MLRRIANFFGSYYPDIFFGNIRKGILFAFMCIGFFVVFMSIVALLKNAILSGESPPATLLVRAGQKVITASCVHDDSQLNLLTRPMHKDERPETYTLEFIVNLRVSRTLLIKERSATNK